MQTVNELFNDAILYDQPKLAYCCYQLILSGYGSKEFNSCIEYINAYEVAGMTSEDILRLERPKVYLAKRIESWACYLAYKESDVKGLHLQLFNEIPSRIIDNTNSIDKSFWFEDLQCYKSLFEIRNELTSFPQFIFEI